jgi:6-phospho-beta-glucosidase
MNPLKLAYIGGGSAYAAGVVRSFAAAALRARDAFADGEIALMDLDAGNLETVSALGRRMVAAVGAPLRITATTDRARALDGATFVLTSFRPGGLQARALDERIPLDFGILGQETVGPGGFFFGLRSLQVMRDLSAERARLCPDAWLLNYTNPTNIIGEAVSRYTKLNVLALGDGGKHDAYHIAGLLGYRPDQVEFRGLGLNHATWSTRFLLDGQDGIALLREAAPRLLADESIIPKTKRMIRLALRYNRLPNEYMQYYYYPQETVAEARAAAAGHTRAEAIMAELPDIFAHYREQADQPEPHLTHQRGGGGFGDFAVEILRAILCDEGRAERLNVPTLGTLPGQPPERVAEVPCRLDRHGATPLAQGPLPTELHGLIAALADYQTLAATAGWEGDAHSATHALAVNPLCWHLDADQVDALYARLAQAHAQWLPARLLPAA